MARRTPQQRLENIITSSGLAPWDSRELAQLRIEPWMIEWLAENERQIRHLRGQLEAIVNGSSRNCVECQRPIGGRVDRIYCSDRCRITAHRHRQRPKLEVTETSAPSRSEQL